MSIIHGRNPSFRQALPYGWNLSPSGEKYSWQDGKSGGAFCRILPVKEGACGVRLCCRSVLVALREAYGSAPAARRQHALQQRQPVFSTRANATCIPGRIACASGGQGYFHHNSATGPGIVFSLNCALHQATRGKFQHTLSPPRRTIGAPARYQTPQRMRIFNGSSWKPPFPR